MNIFHSMTASRLNKHQIGISENADQFCLVYIKDDKVHSLWQQKPYDYNLFIRQAVRFLPKFTVVRPIPYQYIWRKYLFFPAHYTLPTLYQQVIQCLTQELPIPIEEIYFDYIIEKQPENPVIRVAIHALRKNYAEPLLTHSPTILDCEYYCFLRGFHHLYTEPFEDIRQHRYLIGEHVVQFKSDKLTVSEKTPQDEDAADIFRFTDLALSNDTPDPFLFISALGACLWNGKV
ncbi:hypothetical protein [Glaesserella sp.]|uniref:hypothetical protein n=1 Tax=Glaesserella sp. TaxID=2094731 RepID=UPI0035A15419